MQLENEFLVDAPLDQTWSTLLDIQRVAQCLPGAVIESDGEDGVYRGSMQVKLGPMSLAYRGTARMTDVEEDAHSATIEVTAKELRGQGTASARIRNYLRPGAGGGTNVSVQTELSITGRPAQFGRGIMEDVAGRMLEDFAKRLEAEVLRGNGASPGAEAAPSASPNAGTQTAGAARAVRLPGPSADPGAERPTQQTSSTVPAEFDLGSVLVGPLGRRAGIGLGVVVLFLLMRIALRRRKTGLSVTVTWR